MFWLSTIAATVSGGRVYDFEKDANATAGEDASTGVAIANSLHLNTTLALLQPGDELYIPNRTYMMMGGVVGVGLDRATIRVDGTLRFSDDIKRWPTAGKMPLTALTFYNSTGLLFTSNGTGTLDGQGDKWWGIPGVGYLERGKNRPALLSMQNATGLIVERLSFVNSPRFHFISSGLVDATIRFCEVSARRSSSDSHTALDLTAFNTDGFDVAGRNIHVHDVTVWNQDDTVAIKADKGMPTENVLVERVHASGVGLTIGSIGAHEVRNVTFRDVVMHHTSKGIYIKFRDSGRNGSIRDVLYENIVIDTPSSWPIWIGPAQQDIKGSSGGAYNPCHGDPCSLCWPGPFPSIHTTGNCEAVPGLFSNITLRNISILNPQQSPGVIFGNDSQPIQGLVFDGVRVTNPPSDGAWGEAYYYCRGVASGIAMGGTWPVPPCFLTAR